MNELQWAAAKKAAIAVVIAICIMLLFKVAPLLAVMVIFLGGVGTASFLMFLDMEQHKIHTKEMEKRMEELRKRNEIR